MEAGLWMVWIFGCFVFECDAHYSKDKTKYPGPSIVCYECNSAYDPRCGDPFDPYTIGTVNCSLKGQLAHLPDLKPKLCRKTVQIVQGKTRIIRGCGYISDPRDDKYCARRSGTKEIEVFYCSCTKNLCNASTPIFTSTSTLLTFLSVLSAYAILKILRVA